ncbi:MAG TPA: NfeD family protein [Caldithrix abyssi]|uniref:NfeD family protein n=1 Tax=Caldithrix abyssi TaxID=187145 RepID=A0A7V4U0J0_CALAY|nr:NfeD family protein [Caldithrix abyssi]
MNWQEIFTQPAVIWFLIGLVLVLLEFSLPGLIIIFFGIGAWVTALSAAVFDVGLNTQIAVFIITSFISLILLRKHLQNRFFKSQTPEEDTLEDEFIGQMATVAADIKKDREGKVIFKGTNWSAVSEYPCKKGQQVRIVGKESIRLKVEPVKK